MSLIGYQVVGNKRFLRPKSVTTRLV